MSRRQHIHTAETIAQLEARMGRADGAEQRRLVKRIARLRALVEGKEDA